MRATRLPGSHPVKGFCKIDASRACNALMQRDNLYHDAI
jgi:hypothetical protein